MLDDREKDDVIAWLGEAGFGVLDRELRGDGVVGVLTTAAGERVASWGEGRRTTQRR